MSLSVLDCFEKKLEDFLKISYEDIKETLMSKEQFQSLQNYISKNPKKYPNTSPLRNYFSLDCSWCSSVKYCLEDYEVSWVEDLLTGPELEYSCFTPDIITRFEHNEIRTIDDLIIRIYKKGYKKKGNEFSKIVYQKLQTQESKTFQLNNNHKKLLIQERMNYFFKLMNKKPTLLDSITKNNEILEKQNINIFKKESNKEYKRTYINDVK